MVTSATTVPCGKLIALVVGLITLIEAVELEVAARKEEKFEIITVGTTRPVGQVAA